MPQYRKKPVVIEAVQFVGGHHSADVIKAFAGESYICWHIHSNTVSIHTLEGNITASVGDFVIRGVKGEFYPCKPDIFAATYEAVS